MSEIELKFQVSPDDLQRLSRHPALANEHERKRLSTTYFDTPDQLLRAAGLTLRVREVDGGFVQTVKRAKPDQLFDRDEWEFDAFGDAPTPDLLAGTPVADELGPAMAELKPQFTVAVERTVWIFRDPAAEIEISVDRGEIRAGPRNEPVLELELELKSGDPLRLYGLAEELADVAPMRLSFEAKSDRGYRLAAGAEAEPQTAGSAELAPDMTAAVAFARIARGCLVHLSANVAALHREPRPEALHQARIALRRLRSALTVFKSMLKDETFDWVRGELKWLAGETDEARNLDVFHAEARALAGEADEMRRYLDQMGRVRALTYARTRSALESPRSATLMLKVSLWVETGPWTRNPETAGMREEPIRVLAARLLANRHRRTRKDGRRLRKLDAAARHQVRIDAKKLRYAAEFFQSAFPESGKRRRSFIGALKNLQDTLGALNDIAVAEGTARLATHGERPEDLAFAAGQIVGQMRARESKLIDKAVEAYRAFRKAEPFWSPPASTFE